MNILRMMVVFAFSFVFPFDANAAGLQNPLKFHSIQEFVQGFLKAVVYVGMPVAVLFLVYSGFLFVFAQGNSTEIEKAKKNFFWTVTGIALFLGAWALAALIKGTIDQLR